MALHLFIFYFNRRYLCYFFLAESQKKQNVSDYARLARIIHRNMGLRPIFFVILHLILSFRPLFGHILLENTFLSNLKSKFTLLIRAGGPYVEVNSTSNMGLRPILLREFTTILPLLRAGGP